MSYQCINQMAYKTVCILPCSPKEDLTQFSFSKQTLVIQLLWKLDAKATKVMAPIICDIKRLSGW